jgi:hypothetical protein
MNHDKTPATHQEPTRRQAEKWPAPTLLLPSSCPSGPGGSRF